MTIALFCVAIACISPSLADESETPTSLAMPRTTAPVVLDGRELFELGATGSFSATERVSRVRIGLQHVLKPPIDRAAPISVAVISLDGNETIRIDGRHLLTVTGSDIEPGLTATEQAELWRELIDGQIKKAISERSPEYIEQKNLEALQALGIAAILYLLSWEIDAMRRRRLQAVQTVTDASVSRAQARSRSQQKQLHLLLMSGQVAIWAIAVHHITGMFPQTRQWRYNFIASFTKPVLLLGDRDSSILDLVLLLAMLVGLWFGVIWLTERFRTQVLSVTGADRGIQDITIVLSRCVLLFVGLSVLLQIWGIDLASLAVLLSALSVGIGFGLQNIANNFISGIIISFDRSMKVGDFVQLDDLMGTVERIGARSTEIRTPNYVSIVVPNSRFLEQAVVNWSHGSPVSRIRIPVHLAYGSDSTRVREALLEVARGYEPLLLAPEPQVWCHGFGENAIEFELLVWIRDPQNQFRYINELNYRIYDALMRYGLRIPFPQRDVHIRTQPAEHSPIRQAVLRSPAIEASARTTSHIEGVGSLHDIVACMRSQDGLPIGDRRQGLQLYLNVFRGSEAVDWLCDRYRIDRAKAVEIGQQTIARGFVHHITDSYPFLDKPMFYRFYQDESPA